MGILDKVPALNLAWEATHSIMGKEEEPRRAQTIAWSWNGSTLQPSLNSDTYPKCSAKHAASPRKPDAYS